MDSRFGRAISIAGMVVGMGLGGAAGADVLFAGQDTPIGEVTATCVSGHVEVNYVLDAAGWYVVNTHTEVVDYDGGDGWQSIPQKNGNPIPGQFEYTDIPTTAGYTSTAVTNVPCASGDSFYIAAHAQVRQLAEACGVGDPESYATVVVDSDQGTRKNGASIDPARTTPANALGPTDGVFFSLGFKLPLDADQQDGGWIEVGFGDTFCDGSGEDIQVQEVTNGRSSYPEEVANVDVCTTAGDSGTCSAVGQVTNEKGPPTGDGLVGIDFSNNGCFNSAVLIDFTDSSLHSSDADGYDVDSVRACHKLLGEATAWADGTPFPGKNWATYFEFDVP